MPNTDDANKDDRGTAHALRHAGRRTSPRMRTTAHAFSAAPRAPLLRLHEWSVWANHPPAVQTTARWKAHGARRTGSRRGGRRALRRRHGSQRRGPQPHLRRDWAHPIHICTGTGLAPPTSAAGLGSPHPHLLLDWAHPSTSAPGLGSPHPHLRRDWAHPRPASAAGLGSPLPHLRRDWAHLIATSAPGLAGGPGHRGGRDASHEDDHDLAARGGTASTPSTLSTLSSWSTLSAAGCADHWCARACV